MCGMNPRVVSEAVTLVQLCDPKGNRVAHLDSAHSDPVNIDIVHHMIHDEKFFSFVVIDVDVDIETPKYIRITTPNTDARIHFTGQVYVTAASLILLEAPSPSTIMTATQLSLQRLLPLRIPQPPPQTTTGLV